MNNSTSNKREDYIAEANNLCKEGRFSEALEYIEMTRKFGLPMKIPRNKARIYYQMANYDESIKQLKEALSLGRINKVSCEELAGIEFDLSNVVAKKGNIQEARDHYNEYLKLKVSGNGNGGVETSTDLKLKQQLRNAELEYKTGLWYLQAKNYNEAIGFLRKSLEIFQKCQNQTSPLINTILSHLAETYLNLGAVDEAREIYKRLIERNGTKISHGLDELVDDLTKLNMINSEVENSIGCWYMREAGQYDKAISFFQASLNYYSSSQKFSRQLNVQSGKK